MREKCQICYSIKSNFHALQRHKVSIEQETAIERLRTIVEREDWFAMADYLGRKKSIKYQLTFDPRSIYVSIRD